MTIPLGRSLPSASRDRPGRRRESAPDPFGPAVPTWSCSRWGLPCRRRYRRRGALLPHPFTLAARFRKRARRFAFCGTFPGVAPAGRYPAPCFRGARTFLPPPVAERRAAIRPSGALKLGRQCGPVNEMPPRVNGTKKPPARLGIEREQLPFCRRGPSARAKEADMATRFFAAVTTALLLISPATWAQSQSTDPPGRVGRLSAIEGAVQQRTPDDNDWVQANLNYPITAGFAIAPQDGGRAEIQVGSMALR